jgi:EmrB/QacA subfamily drug resistance transporter
MSDITSRLSIPALGSGVRIGGVRYQTKVVVLAISALVLDLLDLTVINVALPAIQEGLGTGTRSLSLVVTSYLATMAVVMPASGWAASRFGAPRVFLFTVAVFTGGSALCAGAWNIQALILARSIAGIGGGLLVPVGMGLLFRAFPESERAKASATFAAPAALAPALGPLLGGLLVEVASWRWIFLINIPVGLATLALGGRWLRQERGDVRRRLDWAGLVLAAGTVSGLLLGLTWVAEGRSGLRVTASLAMALAALGLLIRRESSVTEPLVAVGLFRRRRFAIGQSTMFLTSAGFGGLLFALPLLLESLRHLTAFQIGLILAAHALGIMITTPLAPPLINRVGDSAVLIAGIVGTALTTAALVLPGIRTPGLIYAGLLLLAGMAFGLLIVPLQTMPFASLDAGEVAQASAMLATLRQLGVAMGTSAVALPIHHAPGRQGFTWALLVAAAISLVALVALIGDSRPARAESKARPGMRPEVMAGASPARPEPGVSG